MMNTRGHLPAGQQAQSGADMGPVPPGGPGPRRGGRPQHYAPAHHHHHHYHHQQPAIVNHPSMYSGYMGAMANPYGAPYYMPQQPYQNGAMPSPAYMPYPPAAGYGRSPPAMQHYHMPMQQPYPRLAQHSPIVSSPYHAPPPPVQSAIPPLPHTPSSTHSHVVPPPMTPPVRQVQEAAQPPEPVQPPQQQPEPQHEPRPEPKQLTEPEPDLPPQSSVALAQPSPTLSPAPQKEPFRPPLPWLSAPDSPFPQRTSKLRRRRKLLGADAEGVELPHGQHAPSAEAPSEAQAGVADKNEQEQRKAEQRATSASQPEPSSASEAPPPRSETPSTQDQPSEDAVSTSPTTPSSVQPSQATPTTTRSTLPTVPAVPVIPALPKTAPKQAKATTAATAEKSSADVKTTAPGDGQVEAGKTPVGGVNGTAEAMADAVQPAPAPLKPKLWTGLFAKPASAASSSSAATATPVHTNGDTAASSSGVPGVVGSFAKANASSLTEALQAYRPGAPEKLPFLEPRGLVNTGNMCYMNSVLQVLIFCIPFFDFLDQVSKKAAYSFKSDTPLVDAMVMFMREFKVIDSAASADQLKKRLKSEEYEQYGEPFTPEFVYDAIRKLPRFASMRRGHQQDAQEFLGFLLEGLHDECAQVMRAAPASTASTAPSSSLPSPTSNTAPEGGDDWLEVGPRQRSAVTRSSGHSHTASPITKIFGGQLRSELRVRGNKNSVTLEPYQPLQLDIGSPEIRNIIDALKGLTRPEVLHGDFNSPHGKDAQATKQVFIESVPPVLILHLKRFQFDAEGYGGTVKIWKKVGYPLEFEFPREVLSRQKRNSILAENSGAPRYRLIAVVYHHGKNASGGHYTVDVRRQDGREWIRIDDTIIRRVRDEDVAEGGAEEETPKAGLADSRREAGTPGASNRFVGIDNDDTGDDDGWKQATPGKKWSSVVNGASSPAANGQKAKQHKESMKDNKVAYLLFYQRI
ncbi:putative ubiquitin carboxyl-terminal hydrolase 3 [Madurella mycetomatis]|uniref:Ubiquitin carboxyl-terminal hydrolase n=1 Tax=Madurella mycetomatis TaxID=100816 RepID=A0A175WDR2_9PEZI|nr:putative ubiquitin carboxyl-terminal hydrolase 3 [Madurella mycetomatis]